MERKDTELVGNKKTRKRKYTNKKIKKRKYTESVNKKIKKRKYTELEENIKTRKRK